MKDLTNLKEIITLDNQYLCKIRDYKEKPMNTKGGNLEIYIEMLYSNLEDERKVRQWVKMHFSVEQLISIWYSQVCVNHFLNSQNKFHIDILPCRILLSPNCRYSKLKMMPYDLGGLNDFKKKQGRRIGDNTEYYVSPTVFNNLVEGNYDFDIDLSKECVFNLGLIILEAAILFRIQDLYKRYTFDEELLDNYLKCFEQQYNRYEPFVDVIKRMTSINQEKRPNFQELLNDHAVNEQLKLILERKTSTYRKTAEFDKKSPTNNLTETERKNSDQFSESKIHKNRSNRNSSWNEQSNRRSFSRKNSRQNTGSKLINEHIAQQQIAYQISHNNVRSLIIDGDLVYNKYKNGNEGKIPGNIENRNGIIVRKENK